jgi:hypothetical protein
VTTPQLGVRAADSERMGRAGRAVRSRAREARRQFIVRNRWVISAFTGVYVVITGLLVWSQWTRSSELGAFVVGAALVGLVWFLSSIVALDGQAHRLRGADAEGDTAAALRRLQRRGWAMVDDVPFEGWNVDHVLVGPGGVFAIETKWTSVDWRVASGRLHDGRTQRQALNGAKKVATFLDHHAGVRVHVTPVIAMWGPGRPRMGGQATVLTDGVVLVEGRDCRRYIDAAATSVLTADQIEAAHRALDEFVRERDRYESRRAKAAPVRV